MTTLKRAIFFTDWDPGKKYSILASRYYLTKEIPRGSTPKGANLSKFFAAFVL